MTALPLREALGGVYRGRRVVVTGHTGFKGSWLATWLAELGAEVTGYALPPPTAPSHFEAARTASRLAHVEGDVRDVARLEETLRRARPEVVFHLAAQSKVRESYRDPLGTLGTNVLGTANVLDVARRLGGVALVLVTSDKCYENREWLFSYREDDALGGHDVYSASKAAAELVASSFRRSFFEGRRGVATARAGNVIGGGDFAEDRIVPDAIRALLANERLRVRNPNATRPWQHVLEPLSGYLALGARLLSPDAAERASFSEAFNFGPRTESAHAVRDVVEGVFARWGGASGGWDDASDPSAPHEASLLSLSIEKARRTLGWEPRWGFSETLARTVDWYRAFAKGDDMAAFTVRQIEAYERCEGYENARPSGGGA